MNTQIINTRNRMLSRNLYMSLDTRHTDLNNNILLIGGSGSGKTFKFFYNQLMQMNGSYVVLDAKGDISRTTYPLMSHYGYNVNVLNLLNDYEMSKSTKFNPFVYCNTPTDILKLVTNIISNTTPPDKGADSPFWEKAEMQLLNSLCLYAWDIGLPKGITRHMNRHEVCELLRDKKREKYHNMRAVMSLLNFAEVKEGERGVREDTVFDYIFQELELMNPTHPCLNDYYDVMGGAADTVRSILECLKARLVYLNNDSILSVLDEDELVLRDFGVNKNVLYCVIPDNDSTFSFVIGMLYSVIMQILYNEAAFVYDGSLPLHVTFLMDEFANVALPNDFLKIIATLRSRNLSAIIGIQDISQIKSLFKDGKHEIILSNCDTFIYLGGNGPSTQKELSELMGNMTIDKKTTGESSGKQGSASKNYDIVGRSLVFPDELRTMESKYCIILIRGEHAIMDLKMDPRMHPLWEQLNYFKKKEPVFDARLKRKKTNDSKSMFYTNISRIKRVNEHLVKNYDYEKNIALQTGSAIPEEPDFMVDTDIFGFAAIYDHIINTNCLEETSNILLDNDVIQSNLEEWVEKFKDKIIPFDVRECKNPYELYIYSIALKEGYNERQAYYLKDLAFIEDFNALNIILYSYDTTMEIDTIKKMIYSYKEQYGIVS